MGRAIINMKKITLTNETAQAILSQIDAFTTEKNKLLLTIGIKNTGDGIACKATIVNGGMMGEIGFKTKSVPSDYDNTAEHYFCISVSAATFRSYLKALLVFNAELDLAYDEKGQLHIQVGTQAKVSLPTLEERDTPIACDTRAAYALVSVETSKLLGALKTGGFMASSTLDEQGITDRIVLKLENNTLTVYSTDTKTLCKAWCDINMQVIEANVCATYLKDKLDGLNGKDHADFLAKIQAASSDAASMIQLAKDEGYEKKPFTLALPTNSMQVIRSVFLGSETIKLLLTANHMVINAGNVLATFSLAGKASEVYTKSVDPWQNTAWTAQVVVDKESIHNALSIIRLGGSVSVGAKSVFPFHTTFKKDKMILTDRQKNTVSVNMVNSSGDPSKVDIHLDVEKVLNVLSKMSNGNLVLRYFVNPSGKGFFPVSISNGDLTGQGTTSYIYVLPVNPVQEEQPADSKKKEEKKESGKKDSSTTSNTESGDDIPDVPDPEIDETMQGE